jgi:hypothetical protein
MRTDWLKKAAALALCAAVVSVSPGVSAAQEVAAAARAASALPASVSVPLTFGSSLMAPAPLSAPISALGAEGLVPALALAAAPNIAVPSFAARGIGETPAVSAAAGAAVPVVPAVVAAGPTFVLAASVPTDGGARTSRPAGGLTRLVSAAAGALRFWKPASSNGTLKAEAGRDFDQSVGAPASPRAEPVAAAASSASGVRASGLGKPGPLGPRGPPVIGYRWIGAAVLVGALAVHPSLAASALAKISIPGYYVANIAGSLFPMIQVYEIFKRRSADVSSTTLATGIAASLMLAVNFSYLGVSLAALQNMAGALSFGVIAAQKYWYARRPVPAATRSLSVAEVSARTAVAVAGTVALTFALGKAMLAAVPAVALAGTFLIPFQVLGGLGFAYLMLPAYLKIKRERSVGDSSRGMAMMYTACLVATAIWALNQTVQLATGPAAKNLLPLAAFAAATAALSLMIVRWIASRRWSFIPDGVKLGRWTIGRETLTNVASFLVLAPFMLGIVAAGALIFSHALAIPPESLSKFVAYLFYLVGNIVGATVTGEILRAFREHPPKDSSTR